MSGKKPHSREAAAVDLAESDGALGGLRLKPACARWWAAGLNPEGCAKLSCVNVSRRARRASDRVY